MTLRIGTEDQFESVRALLEECEFDEVGLGEPAGEDDPKALLAALFLQATPTTTDRARHILPAGALDALEALGLVVRDGDECRASVLLYPLHGLHIASDFPREGGDEDFVFPAISQQTHEYLALLPTANCDSLLEIGTGSGAAALIGARCARTVLATDVSPRCLHFAEFNRRLNSADNVAVAESDVYGGLAEETFERIIAHPPYVPWTGKQEIYRHGGADGEAIVRRVLEGLPARLRPGGRLYMAAMGADAAEGPVEDRLRAMLGAAASDFDIALVERETLTPLEFLLPWAAGEKMTFEEAWSLHEAFRRKNVERLVRFSLLVERHAEPRETRTLRRKGGQATSGPALESLLQSDPPAYAWLDWNELQALRPRLNPYVRLEVVQLVDGGAWRPTTRVLVAEGPFAFRTDCPAWAADALPRLDGSRSIAECIPQGNWTEEEAAMFFGCLLDAGILNP